MGTDRREFLKYLGAAAGGAAAAPVFAITNKDLFYDSEPPEGESDFKFTVDRPEGRYTVLHGLHNHKHEAGAFPRDSGAMVVEGLQDHDYVKEPERCMAATRNKTQYEHIFPVVEDAEKEIYMLDAVPSNIFSPIGFMEMGVVGAETGVGAALAKSTYEEANEYPNGMTREKFMDMCGQGILAAGLLSPALTGAAALLTGRTSVGEDASKKLETASQAVHPEVMPLTLHAREAVIAHKEQWLMEEMDGKPHFTTVMGRMHTGIDKRIRQSPEDRLAYLRVVGPLMDDYFHRETVYSAVRFEREDEEWEVAERYEIPELRSLV